MSLKFEVNDGWVSNFSDSLRFRVDSVWVDADGEYVGNVGDTVSNINYYWYWDSPGVGGNSDNFKIVYEGLEGDGCV